MKPFSKLPFYIEDRSVDHHGENASLSLYSADDNEVAEVYYASDAQYIEDACNYFPKAIEFLEEGLDQLETWNAGEEPTFTMRRISEFLNRIKL